MDSPTDLRDTAKRSLLAEVACRFGQVQLKVTGTSMIPSVWPGDILTINRSSAAEVFPGQIILCYRNQGLVAHRLTRKTGNLLITRGDALPCYDPPFQEDELLGRVVSILRNGRRIDPSPAWWQRAGGWILRRSQLSTRVLLGLRTRLGAKTT
jgi:hypothetical protein